MRFAYTATNKDGKNVSGTTEAVDKQSLVASLHKQGLKPVVIKSEASTEKGAKIGRVKSRELVVFTRQLSTMISAGVPLVRALSTMQGQTESKNFRKVLTGISKDVEGGIPLNQAFSKYPSIFSDVYVNMVKAGEAAGILDEILKRLAAQVEQDASMKKKIKTAMAYPVVIMGITVIAFFGIMIFVLPKIGKILTDLGGEDAELPLQTQLLLGISDFFQNNAILVFVVFGAAIFLLKRYISTPVGKYQFHKILLNLPVIKGIVLKIAIARFSRTFASLMGAGVGVLDSLEVTGGAIGNKVIEKELKEVAKQVKNGKPLSEPLAESQYFPAIVSQMLAIGEETGQIDTILVKVADFYEEEASAVIDGLSSIIEPLMIVVLGGIVGLIAASVMGPIASLSQNISTN
jgi:type IV pilus assembly protein PilC